MSSLFIYGGSFDPVHFGHLWTAQAIYDRFQPDQMRFIPCKQSVLKHPSHASAAHRLAMLKLAIARLQPAHAFAIESYELDSTQPSYTIHTLKYLRQHYPPDTAITLIMGIDSFSQLPQWHHWQDLIQLANILVIQRPGFTHTPFSAELQAFMARYESRDPHTMVEKPAGAILLFDAGEYDYSSSAIRRHPGQHLPFDCPPEVQRYIQQHQLYAAG
ncbi:MAG: nicotinate (nicotinamide) nucleotide adenylyltransferase [Legionellaceae bacterium]|nr:nicotinate (nicotinamide) nucleotide adenylyltransferase [Legionellaceae bacterium]